jgi:hypothetical protein
MAGPFLLRETQQQTADAVGCSERFVREVVSNRNKESQSEPAVPVPDWLTNPNQKATFRKLPEEEPRYRQGQ